MRTSMHLKGMLFVQSSFFKDGRQEAARVYHHEKSGQGPLSTEDISTSREA